MKPKKRVAFLPDASDEVRRIFDWYDRQQPGLGADFLEALDRAVKRLSMAPGACSPARDAPRKLAAREKRLRRFPYRIVFFERQDEIRVLAVAHLARRPRYWVRRAEER